VSSTAGTPRRYRWAILAAGVAGQASYAAIFFGISAIAPQIRSHYGLDLRETGVVLAAVNIGSIVTLLGWGLLADRIGERAVLTGGLGTAGAALVGAALSDSYVPFVIALAAAGAFGAGVNSASGRAVMSWFGAEERGLALGIRQTSVPLGGAAASIVLPLLATHVSVASAFLALAGGCGAAAAVGFALMRAEPGDRTAPLGRPLRDREIWLLCLGSSCFVLTQISVLSFLVLFLHDRRGYSTGAAAAVFALTQVLGGVARIVAGRWSDRVGARLAPLRLLAVALAAAVAIAAVVVDAPAALLLPALVAAGTLSLSWNGLSFTAAAETAGRARSGAAIGLQQTFLSGGSIAAAVLFAALVHATSWRLAFAAAALCPLAGYALLLPVSEPRR
jgi:sugar phosphate permease